MTKAKLYYYKAGGRGNQIRLALAASGIEFEDVCAAGYPPTDEERNMWVSIGGNTTTNVPMLVTGDGKVYCQSSAVLRAVARMGGLMPSSDEDLYVVDKILADCEDIRTLAYRSFKMFGASQERVDAFVKTDFPKHLGNLERQLGDGEYFVGSKLSVVDISVYDAVASFGCSCNNLVEFPKIKALLDRVASNPKIAAYLGSEQYAVLGKFSPATLGLESAAA